jgi:hypothetical protein
MGLKTCKNYIISNATSAIIQTPPNHKLNDGNNNTKNDVQHQHEPLFTKKESYGKIPAYLKNVKKEIEREKEIVEQAIVMKQRMNHTSNHHDEAGKEMGTRGNQPHQQDETTMKPLDENERQHLIDALKSKWDYVNSKYQKICHRVFDSLGDMKRKEGHERELHQLEEDIEHLSRPGPIYIQES